jgi:tRNA(Ile)-lysidine synthase
MEGRSVKLADFFVNRKVPRRARDSWPLLCAGEEILWVPGLQLAHPFRVDESTRRIAHLRLTRDEITAEGE